VESEEGPFRFFKPGVPHPASVPDSQDRYRYPPLFGADFSPGRWQESCGGMVGGFIMENHSAKKTAEDLGGFATRVSEAANAVGSHASDALDEVRSAGQSLMTDYEKIAASEKKRVKKAIKSATAFARENSFMIAGGALVVGLLLGHVMTRRGE
jgi:ElaB/YqjD/DUF883 family membrane-anchored ribosome-binding protein